MTDIAGRAALVTGGGSGIGRALALALVAEGASVAVADILLDSARSVVEEVEAAGGTAIAVGCDVSAPASVARAKADSDAALGPVSLVFANAGVTSFEAFTEMSRADIEWLVQADLMGVINCLTAFLPEMIAARDGHVLATASSAGLLPAWLPYHSVYGAAKMGVIGLMLNLRLELAEVGVGASVLCPGGVATGMRDNNARYRPDRFGGPGEGPVVVPEVVRERFAAVDLTFRPPSDVAYMVLRAVRENRPLVVTEPNDRATFQETYVDLVMEAFDEAEADERRLAADGVGP